MLKSDKLKLEILSLLKSRDMSLGQLRKATKVAHHYTIKNAIEFLEKLNLVEVIDKKDKLKTKVVKIR